jgi:hypothetical protein
VFAHVWNVHAGRRIPIDVSDVIFGLVFPQAREIEAIAKEQRPVIALELAVEATDHFPFEAMQDALRRSR